MVFSPTTSTHQREEIDSSSICPVLHLMVGLCSSVTTGQSGSREVSLLSVLVTISISAGIDGVLPSVSLFTQAGSFAWLLCGQENVWPLSSLVVSRLLLSGVETIDIQASVRSVKSSAVDQVAHPHNHHLPLFLTHLF